MMNRARATERFQVTNHAGSDPPSDLEQLVARYRSALAATPDSADLACNLGAALAGLKRWAEACEAYRLALQLRPDFAEVHCNLANALKEQGLFNEALKGYESAIAARPTFAEAYFNLGNMFYSQQQYDRAIEAFGKALAIRPDYAKAANNLGNVYRDCGRLEEAAAAFELALEGRRDYAAAQANLAQILEKLGRHQDAVVAAMRHKVVSQPQSTEALADLGTALAYRGHYDEALDCYGKALELDANRAEVHSKRAVLRLLRGNLEQGFAEFEWRWRQSDNPPRPFKQPRWEGSYLNGRTILLHGEQGLGDVVQFVRYAPIVKERGGTVIVECYRQLTSLLGRTPGIDRIVIRGEPLPDFDVHASLVSLPYILATTSETIPANVPYVRVSPALLETWRAILPKQNRLKVGIAWQGNPKHALDSMRSIPLECFRALADSTNVQLFSLQKGAGSEQLGQQVGFEIIDLGPKIEDFADTAAVLQHLDLLICADTAVLHVAGALGMPAWGLIPRFPDWRWQLEREDSPWYPSLRLFRQSVAGNWADVFQRVRASLEELMCHRDTRTKGS